MEQRPPESSDDDLPTLPARAPETESEMEPSGPPAATETAEGPGIAGSDTGRRQVARFRRRQRIARGVAVVIVVGIAYYFLSLFQVWSTGRADQRDPVDAIVVLGAAQFDGRPSPQLAARLDHVLAIWPDDVAPLVVTTGGNQPGDRFTEAESSANYLIDRGIPADVILLEDEGSSTYESMQGVADLLEPLGLDDIVVVTDPYHALRTRLIAQSVGLNANVSSTTTSVVTGGSSLRRHLTEAGGVAIGRIVGFERLDAWTD